MGGSAGVGVEDDEGVDEVVRACVIMFAISSANLLHPLLLRWRLSLQQRLWFNSPLLPVQ